MLCVYVCLSVHARCVCVCRHNMVSHQMSTTLMRNQAIRKSHREHLSGVCGCTPAKYDYVNNMQTCLQTAVQTLEADGYSIEDCQRPLMPTLMSQNKEEQVRFLPVQTHHSLTSKAIHRHNQIMQNTPMRKVLGEEQLVIYKIKQRDALMGISQAFHRMRARLLSLRSSISTAQ